jgi:membrane-associated protein
MKIGAGPGFWKAALRITPDFCAGGQRLLECTGDTFTPGSELLGLHQRSQSAGNGIFVTSFLDPLISFVSAHAWLGYLTLFLAGLLEAVPVVGSLVPGSTIILALSALVPGGELKLWPVLAAAAAGALLGDGSAYLLGYRSQRQILSAWPMSNYPRVVEQSEAFFNRWGALAVFLARFLAPIRAFVPITAGALGMSPSKFYGVNIPAVLVWALAHVLPGVLAVSALQEYAGLPHHQHVGKHLWIVAVIGGALIVALAFWTVRRRRGGGVIEPTNK